MRHTREDDFTATVDGAAAHARLLSEDEWDDRPTERELLDEETPRRTAPGFDDPWATIGPLPAPPF